MGVDQPPMPELGITLAPGIPIQRTVRGIEVPLTVGTETGRVHSAELVLDMQQARSLYDDLGQFLGEDTGTEAGRCAR
ncbi:hypothetical protein RKE29_01940 [Streptomyces sp. B1866]|uniref:hypothetical protein n=1 Tax=Streptomyces sp. B1866 TaxID=3075431 RepID=UPI0028905CA7|nr:hypothetical protein [Streptomyces sp. B1866]MDT3395421.1 hypothetical protein [Streptomyces sp. B1866]